VRRTIEGLDAARLAELARDCLSCATADEVEDIVRGRLGMSWPNLFPPEILPALKDKG
jgi:hypothetical protein